MKSGRNVDELQLTVHIWERGLFKGSSGKQIDMKMRCASICLIQANRIQWSHTLQSGKKNVDCSALILWLWPTIIFTINQISQFLATSNCFFYPTYSLKPNDSFKIWNYNKEMEILTSKKGETSNYHNSWWLMSFQSINCLIVVAPFESVRIKLWCVRTLCETVWSLSLPDVFL